MMILPNRPWRALLVSFWIAGGLVAAAAAALVSGVVGSRHWPAIGLAVGAGVLAAGLGSPRYGARGYAAWNGWARRMARMLRRLAIRVWYYLVVTPAGLAGRSRPEDRTPEWTPRTTLPADAYRSQDWTGAGQGPERAWRAAVRGWALRPDRLWTVALFPLFALLRLVGDEAEPAPPSTVYTLY